MSDTYKTCSCGSEFTEDEWQCLEFVGVTDAQEHDDNRIEMRNCLCGSTISVVHPMRLTASRTGYICVHGRACQPGGITLCHECPRDPDKVKYRPVYKVTETSDQQIARVLADHSEPHEVQEKY